VPYRDRDQRSAFFTNKAVVERLKGAQEKREEVRPNRCRYRGVNGHRKNSAKEG